MPSKKILILVMAEEKWQEADYLREEIESRGCPALVLDMGLTGSPQGACDISRGEVMAAGGGERDTDAVKDRGQMMPLVVEGAIKKVRQLYLDGELAGVISIGGTTGTQIGTSIMKSLPFGLPKLAVSSTASLSGFASRSIGTADITLKHSVIEIAGLNDLMKNVLSRAAGAICGMADAAVKTPLPPAGEVDKRLVAMTQIGLCEDCAVSIRLQLEKKGYRVIGFSAAGIGDRAMDEIINDRNIFRAVIDLAPGGMGEELLGFTRAAGPDRLDAAGRKGIPQIIAPCAVNLGSPARRNYKPEYEQRKKYQYDSVRTFIRLSGEELTRVADLMAEKLNRALGPVKVLIPLGGWSTLDRRGTDFYDGELDRVFIDELKKKLKPEIEVREIDADLEDPEFADAVVRAFDEVLGG